MNKSKKYFALTINETETEANLSIYGDITSWEWFESDVSSYTLSKQLEALPSTIAKVNVYINSYGGEVAEGLAIYNALKRHKAKVVTYCDGFACSIASVIFMAGDERVMSNASLLMIHNAWTFVQGNSKELRKQADDLDVITQASVNAYMSSVNITEEELKRMLDNETWLASAEALEKGFATSVVNDSSNSNVANQSFKKSLIEMVLEFSKMQKEEDPEDEEKQADDEEDENEDNSNDDDTSNNDENSDDENNDEDGQNKDDEEEKENEKMSKSFEKFIELIGGKNND